MWRIFGKKEPVFSLPKTPESFGQIMANPASFEVQESVLMSDDPAAYEDEEFNEKSASLPRRFIRFLVLGLTFLMPLFFLTFTAPGDVLLINKQALLFAVVLASLILWLVIVVCQGGVVLKLSGLEWGVLAVLVAGLLASSFSSQAYRSFTFANGFISLASLGVLFFLMTNFFSKEDMPSLVWSFLGGSFLAILFGILSIWGIPVFGWVSLLSGKAIVVSGQFNTLGSPSNLGALAVVAFVLALGQHFYPLLSSQRESSKWLKLISFGTALISGLLLLILSWWTFYIALVFGMLAILFGPGIVQKVRGERVGVRGGHLVLPLVILILSLVFVFAGKYFNFGVSGIFLRQSLPVEVSLSQGASMNIAKGVIRSNPAFGVGPGNFVLAYDQFRPESINDSIFWNTRFSSSTSEFFDLATEGGLLALVAFVFLMYFVFRRLKDWKVVPAFIAALALFFLFPFNLVLGFAFWFLIGLLAITGRDNSDTIKIRMNDASLSSIISSLSFVLVLVFGLVGGYILFQKYSGEVYLARAARISGNTQANLDNATNLVAKAVNANSSEDVYLNNLANLLLKKISLLVNDKTMKAEEVKPKFENLTRTVIQIANQMTNNHQNEAMNWVNAGLIYQNLIGLVGGADNAAITAYGEYAKRVKNDPRGYERIGLVYLSRADNNSFVLQNAKARQQEIKNEKEVSDMIVSDYKNAEENFKKAVELKRDLATSLYNLGTVYDRQGRLKEAIKQLELTKILDVNNPGLSFELGLLYYRDGQKDKALAEMAQAVDVFKNYSNARWYLALMLEEKGQIDQAVEQLEEILKLDVNKDNQVVKDKLSALKGGRREFPPGKITSKKPLE